MILPLACVPASDPSLCLRRAVPALYGAAMKPTTAGVAGAAAGLIIGASAGVGTALAVTSGNQGGETVSDREALQACIEDLSLDREACENLMESGEKVQEFQKEHGG